jgi:uncharacterized LabA/DUF88 family protein
MRGTLSTCSQSVNRSLKVSWGIEITVRNLLGKLSNVNVEGGNIPYRTMLRSDDTYLFVDGEYLRRIYCQAVASVFGSHGELNFSAIKNRAGAKRAFIYDCLDEVQKVGEDDDAFKTRVASQQASFEKRRDRGIHIRYGSLRGGTKRIRQKEVDVLLATDMLTHGYDGNMEKAVLIAGDLDFRPVVEALVRRGVFVEVWCEKKSAAVELPGAADFGMELGFNEMYDWSDDEFKARCRTPNRQVGGPSALSQDVRLLKHGSWQGRKVNLFWNPNTGIFVLWAEWTIGIYTAEHDDMSVLERYYEAVHGPVKWLESHT